MIEIGNKIRVFGYTALTLGTVAVYCVPPFFSHYGNVKAAQAKVSVFHNAGDCTTLLGQTKIEQCDYYQSASLKKLPTLPTMDKCTDYFETCQELNGAFKPIPMGFATIQYIGEDGTVGPISDIKPVVKQQWGPLSTCFGKTALNWGEQTIPASKIGVDYPTKPYVGKEPKACPWGIVPFTIIPNTKPH